MDYPLPWKAQLFLSVQYSNIKQEGTALQATKPFHCLFAILDLIFIYYPSDLVHVSIL
jgi:hypothetical protein